MFSGSLIKPKRAFFATRHRPAVKKARLGLMNGSCDKFANHMGMSMRRKGTAQTLRQSGVTIAKVRGLADLFSSPVRHQNQPRPGLGQPEPLGDQASHQRIPVCRIGKIIGKQGPQRGKDGLIRAFRALGALTAVKFALHRVAHHIGHSDALRPGDVIQFGPKGWCECDYAVHAASMAQLG